MTPQSRVKHFTTEPLCSLQRSVEHKNILTKTVVPQYSDAKKKSKAFLNSVFNNNDKFFRPDLYHIKLGWSIIYLRGNR